MNQGEPLIGLSLKDVRRSLRTMYCLPNFKNTVYYPDRTINTNYSYYKAVSPVEDQVEIAVRFIDVLIRDVLEDTLKKETGL